MLGGPRQARPGFAWPRGARKEPPEPGAGAWQRRPARSCWTGAADSGERGGGLPASPAAAVGGWGPGGRMARRRLGATGGAGGAGAAGLDEGPDAGAQLLPVSGVTTGLFQAAAASSLSSAKCSPPDDLQPRAGGDLGPASCRLSPRARCVAGG